MEGSAFRLLYSFPTREEAEEHAECFRHAGVKLALCDEEGKGFARKEMFAKTRELAETSSKVEKHAEG